MTSSGEHCIVISGDVVVGWALTSTAKEPSGDPVGKWYDQDKVKVRPLEGGAWLLSSIIQKLKPPGFCVASPDWGEPFDDQNFNKYNHYFATLKNFEPNKDKDPVWRQSLIQGYSRRPVPCGGINPSSPENQHLDYVIPNDPANPDIVVIEDAGVGYRDVHDAPCWPRSIEADTGQAPWCIIEAGYGAGSGGGIARGELWARLSSESRLDRLIVVTTAEDLRHDSKLEISKNLSWERTAEDCVHAILKQGRLSRCRYFVISFGPVGALLYDHDQDDFRLHFERRNMEDAETYKKGGMWGFTTTLTAAISMALMEHCKNPSSPPHIDTAIEAALEAVRAGYEEGYNINGKTKGGFPAIDFPIQTVTSEIKRVSKEMTKGGEGDTFGQVHIPKPTQRSDSARAPKWSMLGEWISQDTATAEKVVKYGIDFALPEVPIGRYAGLVTVDRKEIESYESIRNLVRAYWNRPVTRNPEPVSIAVFGAPGSGKSYAVKQVVESLQLPHKFLEFNLSQFESVTDLLSAFHVIRDIGLRGEFPVAFWDEFDAFHERDLGWVRHFLYPMQDGKFRQGEIEHPIGRALFVFAGGTSHSLDAFEGRHDFEAAKGPDFMSRIRGHVNLLGTNSGKGDRYHVIRRAILLRTWLEKFPKLMDEKGNADIDDGVLRAFLHVPRYKHGVRSMKAIVETSSLSRASQFGRSNLPAPGQLALHVNARDFMSLVRTGELNAQPAKQSGENRRQRTRSNRKRK
ncbi:hypothetical protein ACFYWX_08370 [Streptomyces sp. NPDC002888]|uniref:hypothetical protein n=1 Tax=Streptomyces sp. NPDC002888 TaxID=3364668 RepID=UPI0036AA5698